MSPPDEDRERHDPIATGDEEARPGSSGSPVPVLPFPVVGVGASAGGVEAIGGFLRSLPSGIGMAFVVVLHLDPSRESHLASIFSRFTSLPVVDATEGARIERDHVYVIVPDRVLALANGRIRLRKLAASRLRRRPVDDMFISLAAHQAERSVAVVLSGTGPNGSIGLKDVKARGGIVLVQDPSTAGFAGMPQNAIDTGLADQVLRLEQMGPALVGYARSPYVREGPEEDVQERQFHELLGLLHARSEHDFSAYKRPTLVRRIRRRMGLRHIDSLGSYLDLLRSDGEEVSALISDMLINVTGFFRDPPVWQALAEQVIDPLVRDRSSGSPVRCWVAGCSTGEEAYTLALLLAERAESAGKQLDVKIFATDASSSTIMTASAGLYPYGIAADLSDERFEAFFDKHEDSWQVKKAIRDMIVFAPQNLLEDPPLSRLDIITCRNLLIYLEPNVQQQALAILHCGLREGGTLLLGNSESVDESQGLFAVIDKKHRIYRRLGPTRHDLVELPVTRRSAEADLLGKPFHSAQRRAPDLEQAPPAEAAESPGVAGAEGRELSESEMEEELLANREELRATIEELETAKKGLEASNQEISSINEEWQSANEELQTSREELQSLNEELNTVNAQLQTKVEELESRSDDLANLLECTDIATLFLDKQMRVKWFTPLAGKLFHLLDGDLGRPLTHFAQRFTDGTLIQDAEQVLKKLVPVEKEVTDDEGRWYMRRTLPYRTSEDRIEGAVVTLLDITERKRGEMALLQAKDEAEHASAAKDRFLAMLSHELRTPLNPAVLAVSELGERRDLPEDVVDEVHVIARNLDVEVRLIDDLLDLARVARGKLQLDIRRVEAFQLLSEVAELLKAEIDAKSQQVTVRCKPEASWLVVDPARMHQVLWNILRNAIQWTDEGGRIDLSCEEQGSEVMLVVTDTGSGIAPDQLKRIFEDFDGAGAETSGLGIGLWIAKMVVDAHGGRIDAESRGRGSGATFRIFLPRVTGAPPPRTGEGAEAPRDPEAATPGAGTRGSRPADAVAASRREPPGKRSAPGPRAADAGTGARLLLVEDHADSARTLKRILEREGHTVAVAHTLEDARRLSNQHSFDLVLSDLALPDGDGHELMRQLSKRGMRGVALSGYGTEADIRRSREAGFLAHIVKPINLDRLREVLRQARSG